ncbi:MAG: hypothetical protein CMM07_09375 [Rhodopirellula sp.]|nr:hypothetical protein [Rhodopirellula sp.]
MKVLNRESLMQKIFDRTTDGGICNPLHADQANQKLPVVGTGTPIYLAKHDHDLPVCQNVNPKSRDAGSKMVDSPQTNAIHIAPREAPIALGRASFAQ